MSTVFHEWRNRAFAELDAPINWSATTVVLKAWHGNRMSDVTTASGRKVRANIYHRDPDTGEITKIEEVRITNNVSDVLTIARAVSATRNDTDNTYAATAQSFEAWDFIEEVVSSDVMDEIRDAINALETGKLDLSTYKSQRTVYSASSTGNDSYAITTWDSLSVVDDGRIFAVRADVANTWAASLNVDWLGAINLQKISSWAFTDLTTWDIIANQIFFAMKNTAAWCYQFSLDPATLSVTVPNSDTTQRGIIEQATDTEALTFTDTDRAINAYQLWLAVTMPEQDIPYVATTTVARASTLNVTSNSDGSVLFIVAQGSSTSVLDVFRLERDTRSKHYNITHQTTITPGGSWSQLPSCAVLGSYLYVFSTLWGTAACTRLLAADLTWSTAMTISGTAWTSGQTAFANGTDLYVYTTTNQFYRYTVSGTTITNAATITYTSAWAVRSACCDNNYVWMWLGDVSGTNTLKKYAISWGAATTTKDFYIPQVYPNFSYNKLFIASNLSLWYAIWHTIESNTAVTWAAAKLTKMAMI